MSGRVDAQVHGCKGVCMGRGFTSKQDRASRHKILERKRRGGQSIGAAECEFFTVHVVMWMCGCMGISEYGCMGVVSECMGVWIHENVSVWIGACL